MIDEGRLNQLIGQMVSDLGGASSVAMVRIGDALGLYKALHANGAMTAAELGSSVGAHERYVREWLSNQPASNISPTIPPRGSSRSLVSRPWCSLSMTAR
jgi:hypothetical protein